MCPWNSNMLELELHLPASIAFDETSNHVSSYLLFMLLHVFISFQFLLTFQSEFISARYCPKCYKGKTFQFIFGLAFLILCGDYVFFFFTLFLVLQSFCFLLFITLFLFNQIDDKKGLSILHRRIKETSFF